MVFLHDLQVSTSKNFPFDVNVCVQKACVCVCPIQGVFLDPSEEEEWMDNVTFLTAVLKVYSCTLWVGAYTEADVLFI